MLVLVVTLAIGLWLIMISAWAFQRWVDNPGWVDVFWTFGTGTAGVVAALYPMAGQIANHLWPTDRQLLVSALVATWSLRLGVYMAIRVATSPEDARYIQLRENWGASFQRRMFVFMQNQGIGSIVFPLSILIAARNPAPGLRATDWLGAAILVIAIIGESLADRQMRRFKAAPTNRGKVCDVGLWSWSRHPNYFFEWLGWFAYPVIAMDFSGAYPWGVLALSAPALMYWVLNHGTGTPHLERHMARSRGEAWQHYRARTNAFIPLPPSRSAAP